MTPLRAAALVLLFALPAATQTRPATQPAVAGRIVEVVCYETTALVTREVEVPAGAGLTEVTIGPLPQSLRADTIYAESDADGVRVLTTRYRQRVERDATDETVRELTAEVERLAGEIELAEARRQGIEQDLAFVERLEGFATAGLNEGAGDLDLQAGGFIEFATFITERRRDLLAQRVETSREIADLQEQRNAVQQRLGEAQAGGGGRVVREATVVVDNPDGAAATVRLAYLVNAAGWRPQYRLRAEADLDAATLEYLAAVFQNTGEDWRDVRLTLSTASPNLNASPPELDPVRVALVPGESEEARQRQVARASKSLKDAQQELQQAQSAYGQQAGGFGGGGGELDEAADAGVDVLNVAANRVLEAEVLGDTSGPAVALQEGQSVTFRLDGRVTVPWRDDEQLLEIARQSLSPDVFYKAVPVLTPNVYRVADLTNDGADARVILPGPCGVYLGGDFVGRTALPLVAVGRPFSVGLGIDPQLAVTRELVSRDSDVRGGNQVRRVEYLLRVENFKDAAVPVRLFDRLPTGPEGEEANALGVELVTNTGELSDDADYLRDERPAGILRWDLDVAPGEPAQVRFAYTLAFDRALEIGGFETAE